MRSQLLMPQDKRLIVTCRHRIYIFYSTKIKTSSLPFTNSNHCPRSTVLDHKKVISKLYNTTISIHHFPNRYQFRLQSLDIENWLKNYCPKRNCSFFNRYFLITISQDNQNRIFQSYGMNLRYPKFTTRRKKTYMFMSQTKMALCCLERCSSMHSLASSPPLHW